MKKYLPYILVLIAIILIGGVSLHYSQQHLKEEFIKSIPYSPPKPVSIDFGELLPIPEQPIQRGDLETYHAASRGSDPTACNDITNSTLKNECSEEVNYKIALANRDKNACQRSGVNKDTCLQALETQDGVSKRTTATCRNLSKELQMQCYTTIEQTFFPEGEAICRSHALQVDQDACLERFQSYQENIAREKENFIPHYNDTLVQIATDSLPNCLKTPPFYGLPSYCRIMIQATHTEEDTIENLCAALPDQSSDVLIDKDKLLVGYMNEQEACRILLENQE